MKKLKNYLPSLDAVWKGLESTQRTLEGVASVVLIAMTAFWLTDTIQNETFDFEKDSILELVTKGAPFILFGFLVTSNICVSQFGSEQWAIYWYNCFGKISFECVLVVLIYWLTDNVYYSLAYSIYASYAVFYFCLYGHLTRLEQQKEEVKAQKIKKDEEGMSDVYKKLKAKFPSASMNADLSRNRKMKRGRRM